MSFLKWKRKKPGKKYDFWTDKNGQTLYVQHGENILVMPLQYGNFNIEECVRLNDPGCDIGVLFNGNVLVPCETEKDARRALGRLRKTLKKGGNRKTREWIALAAVAVTFIVGMTFATAYSTSVGLSQPVAAPSPVVAQQVQPPIPPALPADWIDPPLIPVATRWSFGNPKGRPIYVFSDPQCPHCKNLEKALSSFKEDYYIHVYPTPRLGDDSAALIVQFSCGTDPAKAWSNWMSSGALNDKAEIKNECAKAGIAASEVNRKFMDQHNLFAVPVLIREDGAVHTGDLDKTNLQQWLQSKKISKVTESTCN